MSTDPDQVQQAIRNAREALRLGDKSIARHWAEQAARLAPETEEPWLLLTAVSEPRAALEYAKRALVINPQSQRARKAVDWARNRLGPDEAAGASAPTSAPVQSSRAGTSPLQNLPRAVRAPAPAEPKSPPAEKKSRRTLAYAILLVGLACIVAALAGYSAINVPAVASILSVRNQAAPTSTPVEPYSAQVEIDKPTLAPEATFTPSPMPTDAFTFTPSATPTLESTSTPEITTTPIPTDTPLFTDTPLPTNTPSITDTPGIAEAVIVPDTPTSSAPPTKAYVAPTRDAYAPPPSGVGSGTRWIDVNLSQQRVYAYEGDVVVNSFLASTGTWQYPTVTGDYKIYVKYRSTTMAGPGYNLPNVPYTMYFYKGYGIHGTYWHNNFGVPMSHGCVNLSIPDAQWMYNWASVGTVVHVHY